MDNVKLAFTGRRDELSTAQRMRLGHFINVNHEDGLVAAHNGADGDDAYFARYCAWAGISVEHPGEGLRPMPANRALVTWCDILVGCPPTEHLEKRSGTWQTILYGFKYGKSVTVITPSGAVILERSDIPKQPKA